MFKISILRRRMIENARRDQFCRRLPMFQQTDKGIIAKTVKWKSLLFNGFMGLL